MQISFLDTTTSMCTMRKADRDLAEQITAIRAFAPNVPITSTRLGAEVGQTGHGAEVAYSNVTDESGAEDDLSPSRRLFADDEMQERLAWARRLRLDTREGVLTALQRAADAGPMRRIGRPGSAVEFDELRAQFPHFAEVLKFVWNRALLAGSVAGAAFRLPPILLDGPPGVGKTAFAEKLAAWLGVPISRVDMSSLDAAFKLTGLDAGYSTAKPGIVWDMLQGPCISPVLVLDEFDKTSAGRSARGSNFLLGLLEPLTAGRFQDACIGLPVNAAHIHWIATSNDLSAIDGPVLSRFRVFSIGLPSGDQRARVVESVYVALRTQEEWAQAFPEHLPHGVVEVLIERSAREVRQALEDACANAVAAGRRELRVEDVPSPRALAQRPIGFVNPQM